VCQLEKHIIQSQGLMPTEPDTSGASVAYDAALAGGELLSTSIPEDGPPIIGPSLCAPQFPTTDPEADSSAISPYSRTRSTLRSLTLPVQPNLNIPPSPPGSPPPGLNDKISHFLSLKEQGVHFNAKLATYSALKNPSLLPKLMALAGLGVDGNDDDDERDGGWKAEYMSTMPLELWDPAQWPAWAYKEELYKSNQQVGKRKEAERLGKQRAFVPAHHGDDVQSGRGSAGSGLAARVMAGLDQGDKRSSTDPSRERNGRRGKWDEREVKRRKRE
ncbi:MAG: hypothetical protein Q9163_005195, partial [Psora crenata]